MYHFQDLGLILRALDFHAQVHAWLWWDILSHWFCAFTVHFSDLTILIFNIYDSDIKVYIYAYVRGANMYNQFTRIYAYGYISAEGDARYIKSV